MFILQLDKNRDGSRLLCRAQNTADREPKVFSHLSGLETLTNFWFFKKIVVDSTGKSPVRQGIEQIPIL
jgi:hypothetical protein